MTIILISPIPQTLISPAMIASMKPGGQLYDDKIGWNGAELRGALQTIYDQSFGQFLLAVVAIGLLGFALWCVVQAWFDTEGKGRDAKGIICRLGYAVTGVSYFILAFEAFQ
jgi:hypothetical protein